MTRKPVGAFANSRVVGNDYNCGTAFVNFAEKFHYLFSSFTVQSAGWFISKNNLGFCDHCSGDCNSLLLSAGKFVRSVIYAV